MSGRPTSPVRLAWLHLRVNAMRELQYRANFFAQLAQSAIALVMALAALAIVYSKTPDLNGWQRPELLTVIGVYTLLGGVIRAFVEPAMNRLLSDIHLGTFDFALTKPADAQLLASVRDLHIWQTVDIVVGGIIVAVASTQTATDVGWSQALAFAAMLVFAGVMIYCTWLIVSTGGFWLVRMDMVHELFNGLYRSAQYPITVYPTWLRAGLTFVIPLGIAVTAPAEAVTSRLSWATVAVCAFVAGSLVVVSRVIWRLGIRRYSGASA